MTGPTKQGGYANDRTVRTHDFGTNETLRQTQNWCSKPLAGTPALVHGSPFRVPTSTTRSDVGTRHDLQRLHVVPHMLEAAVVVVMVGRLATRRRRTVAARPVAARAVVR